jgi:hypothetical protein
MRKVAIALPEDVENLIRERAEARGWTFSEEARALLYAALGSDKAQERIADTTERLIREGLTNAQVLEEVRRVHGPDRGSENTVAWYRSQLRKTDPSVISYAEARRDKAAP